MRRIVFLAALCAIATPVAVPPAHAQRMVEDESTGAFVLPDGLVSAVEFWKSIYATYDTRQVVMHDNRYLHVVYGVLDFRTLAKTRTEAQVEAAIREQSDEERERLIAVLLELDSYKDGIPFGKLTQEQRNIYDAFEDIEEIDKFAAAAERVRGQRGQADRFLNGIAEVAPYMPELEQIFRAKGLPTDLTRLVFVESMFNLHAYSKVGAAGPWQFMSYTGKRFMTISPEVDERMDPILASQAAANLLHENYSHLGDWGLALTAYNHGVAGMKRAANEVGSNDIGQIVWAYQSRSFGFASRNFYAEFLAARDVYNNRERYFGAAALAALPLHIRQPYDEILLPDYIAVGTLTQYCNVTVEELKALNPSLTRYVLSGQKYLPKAYPLKIPAGKGKLVVKGYAEIPSTHRYVAQKANEFHVVRKGENLATISKKYGMTVDGLVDLNGISARNRIRTGQKLRVLPKEGVAVATVAAAPAKAKKPEVKVVPLVKLPEDVAAEKTVAAATASANNTEPPVQELPEEQLELLAQSEAPAVDGKAVALADSTAVPPAPYSPPAANALARGTLAFASLSAALTVPKTPVSIASQPLPVAAAAGTNAGSLAVSSAVAAAVAPLGASALAAAIPSSVDLDLLVPIRPATAPLAPARDRANAREGRPAATYPGGIRCALTGR
jgi:membrane-bound lytic murein transglycosylase D